MQLPCEAYLPAADGASAGGLYALCLGCSALNSSFGLLVSLELVRGREPSTRCYAVKSRIINEELSTHRDTWGKWLFGIWDDTPLDRIRAVQAKVVTELSALVLKVRKSYVKEVLFGGDR